MEKKLPSVVGGGMVGEEERKNDENSERSGRLIDQDQLGSMEKKKKQGYF